MPQPLQRSPYGPDRNSIGTPFIELQSVDSTNNYARSLLHEGLAGHGAAIFAHEQIAGKGQRGKIWVTERDANLIISVLIKPEPLHLLQQFQLSACVAVTVQEFFSKYAGDGSKIKWPNDLYWQDRKAGGILIESGVGSRESGVGGWQSAVVGIGININQTVFPSYLPNPVSLKQITGQRFNTVTLAKELCDVLNKKFTELMNEGFENTFTLYLLHLYKRNVTVKLKKGSRVFEATIKAVSPSGKLIVQHAIEEEFDFGEIEWIL